VQPTKVTQSLKPALRKVALLASANWQWTLESLLAEMQDLEDERLAELRIERMEQRRRELEPCQHGL